MTRAEAKRLSGRLAVVHSKSRSDSKEPFSMPPGVVLGYGHGLEALGGPDSDFNGLVLLGWPGGNEGWSYLVGQERRCLFGDEQGCARFWWVDPRDLDILPPGAGLDTRKRRRP